MHARHERSPVRTALSTDSKGKDARYGRTGTEVPPSSVRIRGNGDGPDTDEADRNRRRGTDDGTGLPGLRAGLDRARNLQ